MKKSVHLEAYLNLEETMFLLRTLHPPSPLVERLLDVMDVVWLGLSNEEHAWLNSRP